MGYYVNGEGHITIDHDKVDDAYKALCKLNDNDDLKSGGSWGGRVGEVTADSKRPDGMSYHPAKWFSWMDADYPSKCKDLVEILESLGFEVQVSTTTNTSTTYYLYYDQKIGQENLFLQALAPYLSEGAIKWRGEDMVLWKQEFMEGKMVHKDGYIAYK